MNTLWPSLSGHEHLRLYATIKGGTRGTIEVTCAALCYVAPACRTSSGRHDRRKSDGRFVLCWAVRSLYSFGWGRSIVGAKPSRAAAGAIYSANMAHSRHSIHCGTHSCARRVLVCVQEVVKRAIDEFELAEHALKAVREYSGGTMRKLCAAIALIGNPDLMSAAAAAARRDPLALCCPTAMRRAADRHAAAAPQPRERMRRRRHSRTAGGVLGARAT